MDISLKSLYEYLKNSRDLIAKFSFSIGIFFILFTASILIFTAISFTLGYSINPLNLILGFIFSFILLYFWIKKEFKKKVNIKFIIILSIILILFISSLFISGYFYDISYDGRLYHQFTISHLANGWNPFTNPYNMNGVSNKYGKMKKSIWSVVYPRALEICSANIYSVTGKIEQGKAFNLLAVLSAFFISFATLLSIFNFSVPFTLIISTLLAFNPVSTTTLFSYYVDGFLSSILLMFFSVILLFFKSKEKRYLPIILPLIIIIINIKFTGLAYGFFISLGIIIGLLIKRDYKTILTAGLIFIVSGIIGFFFIGYSPYITNFKKYGHPLHPIMGKNKMSGLLKQRFLAIPENLMDKNRFEKFFISIMSKSEFIQYPNKTHFKIPFSVEKREILNFKSTHVRIGGWGPLFGGIFILSIILFLPMIFKFKKNTNYVLFLGLVILSVIINGEFWYARLAPQVYLIPFIIILPLITKKNNILSLFVKSLFVMIIINMLFIYFGYFSYQIKASSKLHKNLERISRYHRVIELDAGIFKSAWIMFSEAGIKYKEVDKISKYKRKINLGHGIKVGL